MPDVGRKFHIGSISGLMYTGVNFLQFSSRHEFMSPKVSCRVSCKRASKCIFFYNVVIVSINIFKHMISGTKFKNCLK